MLKFRKKSLALCCLHVALVLLACLRPLVCAAPAHADVQDPFDPFQITLPQDSVEDDDKDKSAAELVAEADLLLKDERLLDARTKLLKALAKDPEYYEAHILLAGYYSVHVGHFRLALKYIKQALALFQKKNGLPPYQDYELKAQHAQILYFTSQIKLDLDNYQGALDILDEYQSYGYYQSWYPGARAWILMKLGRVPEGIKVARTGMLMGAEAGRTLNILGILLSMVGERRSSLDVFRQAVNYELALGELGQPATPINNSAEVYDEIFEEDKARSNWLKAVSLPDGCEHILPALNLALLYVEQLNFSEAKDSLDGFERCVAQYPLRNGEEHRALENLMRGRLALHSGQIDLAIKFIEQALEKRQWFGKIGTDQRDLTAASMISLSQALRARNNLLSMTNFKSTAEWLDSLRERVQNRSRIWWLNRRALQILTEDLSDLEDLFIKNTDSLIEYSTFGDTLARLPKSALERRIDKERRDDLRPEAQNYYDLYLAQNYLEHGYPIRAVELLDRALERFRARYDDGARVQALLLKLSLVESSSEQYRNLTETIYELYKAALRNHGYKLPVNFRGSNSEILHELEKSAFIIDNSVTLPYSIDYEQEDKSYILSFLSSSKKGGNVKVKAEDLTDAVNKLADAVFSTQLERSM